MMKKSVFSASVLTAVLAFTTTAWASDISIVVNGNKIDTDKPPVIQE